MCSVNEDKNVTPPIVRPRRLRTTPAMRRMVAETAVQPGQLDIHASVIMVYHLRPAGEAGEQQPDRMPPRE